MCLRQSNGRRPGSCQCTLLGCAVPCEREVGLGVHRGEECTILLGGIWCSSPHGGEYFIILESGVDAGIGSRR